MTYDDYKLATPPEYEQPDYCLRCREEFADGVCACGDADDRADDEYGRWCDAMEAKAEQALEGDYYPEERP